MKTKNFIGGGYALPSVERIDISVERGFAISGDGFNDGSLGGGIGVDDSVILD